MTARLDLSPALLRNLRRARRFGRKELLVHLGAKNCPGCETLQHQLRRPGVGRLLAGRTYQWYESVGDLHVQVPSEIDLAGAELTTPGYPTTLAFRVLDAGLQLLAVALGPLDGADPEGTLADLLECRSWVVPEARSARLSFCVGGLCVPLHEGNGFRADVRIAAPVA